MELVTHVANEHDDQEEAWTVKFQSTPKSDKEENESSFVFSESMLDEFLVNKVNSQENIKVQNKISNTGGKVL